MPTSVVTIRLDVEDLEMARGQAVTAGLKYQTYVRMLLHEALLRREGATGSAPRGEVLVVAAPAVKKATPVKKVSRPVRSCPQCGEVVAVVKWGGGLRCTACERNF